MYYTNILTVIIDFFKTYPVVSVSDFHLPTLLGWQKLTGFYVLPTVLA